MAQPKILLTRIDDRFIYGQDVELWNEAVGSNLVLIVNDEIAADSRQWAPMRVAAPEGVWTRFFSVQKAIDIIHTATPRQLILIMVASLSDALALVKGGVPITKIGIGCRCRRRYRHRRLQRVAKDRYRARNPPSPQFRPRSHRQSVQLIPWGWRKTDHFALARDACDVACQKLCPFTTFDRLSPSMPDLRKTKLQVDGSRM